MGFDIEKSFIMAERMKQLREEKGLSHEKLSKALFDQYGVKISSDSLINYEVADAMHTKAYKNQGMRVEYLRCLADFYGVSADYILGQINDPCRAPSAIDDLGLSEKAVRWLADLKTSTNQDLATGVNRILENVTFQLLVYEIYYYAAATKAEAIYNNTYSQYFDIFPEGKYLDAASGEEIRRNFDSKIQEIAKSGVYSGTVSDALWVQGQLWCENTPGSELSGYLHGMEGFNVSDVSAYRVNKYLANLLEIIAEDEEHSIGEIAIDLSNRQK